jgi:hypothetical protein
VLEPLRPCVGPYKDRFVNGQVAEMIRVSVPFTLYAFLSQVIPNATQRATESSGSCPSSESRHLILSPLVTPTRILSVEEAYVRGTRPTIVRPSVNHRFAAHLVPGAGSDRRRLRRFPLKHSANHDRVPSPGALWLDAARYQCVTDLPVGHALVMVLLDFGGNIGRVTTAPSRRRASRRLLSRCALCGHPLARRGTGCRCCSPSGP